MSKDAAHTRTSTDTFQTATPYQPLTDIEYAEDIRFKQPPKPQYPVLKSLGSILSLCLMASAAYVILSSLIHPNTAPSWMPMPPGVVTFAAWTWLPFAFTLFGATLGALYEAVLLLKGAPFQLNTYPFVQRIRLLNVAPVLMSIFAFAVSMTVTDIGLRTGLLFIVGFIGSGAAFAAFYGGANSALSVTLMSAQLIQIAFALTMIHVLPGAATAALIGASVFQFVALRVGAATPTTSTGFHVLSTIAGVLLYVALYAVSASNPNFSYDAAVHFSTNSLLFWGLIAACVGGLVTTAKLFPLSYNNWRAGFFQSIVVGGVFFLGEPGPFPKTI